MPETNMQELIDLKQQLTDFKVDVTEKIGKLETEVRVVKHDFVNIKDMINGAGVRMDKMEERLTAALSGLGEKVAASNAAMLEKIATINVQQQRSGGFVAGVIAAGTVAASAILFLAKLLFAPGHP